MCKGSEVTIRPPSPTPASRGAVRALPPIDQKLLDLGALGQGLPLASVSAPWCAGAGSAPGSASCVVLEAGSPLSASPRPGSAPPAPAPAPTLLHPSHGPRPLAGFSGLSHVGGRSVTRAAGPWAPEPFLSMLDRPSAGRLALFQGRRRDPETTRLLHHGPSRHRAGDVRPANLGRPSRSGAPRLQSGTASELRNRPFFRKR